MPAPPAPACPPGRHPQPSNRLASRSRALKRCWPRPPRRWPPTRKRPPAPARPQRPSAENKHASARPNLSPARSSAALYGQGSTFTALPSVGQIVRRGQSLYEIGSQPVLLLYGSTPATQAFLAGMAPGPDVAELNANLDALGYGQGLA